MRSPITGKEMTLVMSYDSMIYKGEKISYKFSSYLCEESGITFTTTELDTLNLRRARIEYDRIHCCKRSESTFKYFLISALIVIIVLMITFTI